MRSTFSSALLGMLWYHFRYWVAKLCIGISINTMLSVEWLLGNLLHTRFEKCQMWLCRTLNFATSNLQATEQHFYSQQIKNRGEQHSFIILIYVVLWVHSRRDLNWRMPQHSWMPLITTWINGQLSMPSSMYRYYAKIMTGSNWTNIQIPFQYVEASKGSWSQYHQQLGTGLSNHSFCNKK